MSNNNNNNQPKTTKFKPGLYDSCEEMGLDISLKKELADAGLKPRMIDYKQAKENGNRSRNGWIIYRGLEGNKEPVRMGTTVLAVKTDDAYNRLIDKRKLRLKFMNRYNENKEKELRSDASKLGGSKLISGFEANN